MKFRSSKVNMLLIKHGTLNHSCLEGLAVFDVSSINDRSGVAYGTTETRHKRHTVTLHTYI